MINMAHRKQNLLFSDGDLSAALRNHLEEISEKVDEIPKKRFLESPEEKIVVHVLEEQEIKPLELDEENMVQEKEEVKIDVSDDPLRNPSGRREQIKIDGTRVTVTIPWKGDHHLWKLRPSQYSASPPRGKIRYESEEEGVLKIVIEKPNEADPEDFKEEFDRIFGKIKSQLENQQNDLEGINDKIESKIRDAISVRKERLNKQDEIAEELGIPLKKNEDAPDIDPIEVQKTNIKPSTDKPESRESPEPGIRNDTYEHILKVIRHQGRTFESTPETYSVHDEEELRDILLSNLNSHYEGDATGETFRKKGKTDIRIENNSRAAFIAECKIWRGPKSLSDALEQLLDYATWRDCKCALVIFNKRNESFSDVLEKIPASLQDHDYFINEKSVPERGEWRFRFNDGDGESREFTIHVLAFDIPSGDD